MKQFNSKYNIGQNVAEGIYNDLTEAFLKIETGFFDKAFNKFRSIKGKIPSEKIKLISKKKFKALDELYSEADKGKNTKKKYQIAIKYSEILVNELDNNNMYLPSLKDMSSFA
jgi:hypothetical protein